jgi:preprotein translocase subunit SecG
MITVLIIIHLMIVVALVCVVLLQRSEGGALGIGGGGGGGFFTGRGAANALTRATAILAAGFFATSLALAILAGHGRVTSSGSIFDSSAAPGAPAPAGRGSGQGVLPALKGQQAPAEPPATPAAPAGPQVPQSQ